jgi:2-oxoglutarate ferredoxin oxidoreductase subunit beta
MARPELNVLVVAGDGDFLSIGGEHIGPQAARNLNICAVIMDNGVYGLTKGQSSPTTKLGVITSSTPYGKIEAEINPLELYLTLGVSYIASGFSGQPRPLSQLIKRGMEHSGFSIVHVQSPCTTYNDTFEELKGNPRKGIDPTLWDVPEEHDTANRGAAYDLIQQGGLPVGVVYADESRPPLEQRVEQMWDTARARSAEELMSAFEF